MVAHHDVFFSYRRHELERALPLLEALTAAGVRSRHAGHPRQAKLRVLGPKHPRTLTARNNLALTIHAQGHFVEARRWWRTAAARGLEQVAGAQEPAEARTRQIEVLETAHRLRGPDHPDTVKALTTG